MTSARSTILDHIFLVVDPILNKHRISIYQIIEEGEGWPEEDTGLFFNQMNTIWEKYIKKGAPNGK